VKLNLDVYIYMKLNLGLTVVLSKDCSTFENCEETVYHLELQVVLEQQDMPFTLCHNEPSGGHGTHVRRHTQAL